MNEMLSSALDYLERGWSVLPIAPQAKWPHRKVLQAVYGDSRWKVFQSRRASADEVRAWFRLDPNSNVAIVGGSVSSLVVVDFDRGERLDVVTPTVATRSGTHQYFSSSVAVGLYDHACGEVRGDGGYVLAPPSLHPSGWRYAWLDGLSPADVPLVPFAEIASLVPPTAATRAVDSDGDDLALPRPPLPEGLVPVIDLPMSLLGYRQARPSRSERKASGVDGSEMEWGIVCHLLDAGCSDEQIRAYFDFHALPRHSYELHRLGGYGWLDRTIQKARNRGRTNPSPSAPSPTPSYCVVDEPFSDEDGLRPYVSPDLHVVLRLVRGQLISEWLNEIVSETGTTRSTAKRKRQELEASKHIEIEPRDGRSGFVHLTALGQRAVQPTKSGLRRAIHLPRKTKARTVGAVPYLVEQHGTEVATAVGVVSSSARPATLEPEGRGFESPASPAPSRHEADDEADTTTRARVEPDSVDERPWVRWLGTDPLVSARMGFDGLWHGAADADEKEISRALERDWIDGTPRLSFLGKQSSWLLQFLSREDELVKDVLFYNQLSLGSAPYRTPQGHVAFMPVYRSFISQNDGRVEDGGEDLIQQRQWGNWAGQLVPAREPRRYTFGLGVVMDDAQTPASYTVVNGEGVEVIRPRIGLIVEPDWTFWKGMRSCVRRDKIEDITEHLFEVTRTGRAPSHRFRFRIAGDAAQVSIPAEAEIDLDSVLNNLVSEQRLEACIAGLGERHRLWGW